MSEENTNTTNDEIRGYELAFNIVPTVGDAEVNDAFGDVKTLVEKAGKVTATSAPAMIPLAYTMDKTVDSKKRKYNTAYFAWIKFDADPENIEELQKTLDNNFQVLRYMVIKSDKETNIPSEEVASMLSDDEEVIEESDSKEESKIEEPSADDVAKDSGQPEQVEDKEKEADKDEEIDKAIDGLVEEEK